MVDTLEVETSEVVDVHEPARRSVPAWLVVFGVGAIGTLLLTVARSDLSVMPSSGTDGDFYALMGFQWRATLPPFTYRILQPSLVRVLWLAVFSVPAAAAIVNALMMGVAYSGLHHLLARVTRSRAVIAFGLAVLAVSRVAETLVADPYRVDAGLLAFCTLILVCLVDRPRWVALALLVPLGVLCHELVLVTLIPIGLAAHRERAWWKAVGIGAAGVGLYFVLHKTGVLYGTVVGDRPYWDPQFWSSNLRFVADERGSVLAALWLALTGSAGVAWAVAPWGWRSCPRAVRDFMWVAPAALPMFLIATDWHRLLIPVIPAVVTMAAAALAPTPSEDVIDLRESAHASVSP